jgi:hypothetical protein
MLHNRDIPGRKIYKPLKAPPLHMGKEGEFLGGVLKGSAKIKNNL